MFYSLQAMLRPIRERAVEELKAVRVASADAQLALDASSAEVIDQSETVQHDEGQVSAYYLTQIVRNPEGEYFLLKTTDRRPYAKHLPQDRAKHVLKAKYRPPVQSL
jgi:hypothetical protein